MRSKPEELTFSKKKRQPSLQFSHATHHDEGTGTNGMEGDFSPINTLAIHAPISQFRLHFDSLGAATRARNYKYFSRL